MKSLRKLLANNSPLFLFILLVIVFFYPFFLFGKVPIPADTIVGMYHPFRDVVWNGYKAGVPFKNFLITDPVRQQYVWRKLAIEELKKSNLPLWNPYNFSGTPLLANFQTAVFYPLNILFFILPFNLAWGILVVMQPLLAGIFLYLHLRFINISKKASFLGGLSFAFSGFAIAWMEWNTILHTGLWLPFTLLCIEKVIYYSNESAKCKVQSAKLKCKDNKFILWSLLFIFSLISSFFSGHLQIFFYSFLLISVYTMLKVILFKRNRFNVILLFLILNSCFLILTSIQWLPTLKFILLSARDFDQGSWLKVGWFIPWQNLVQFIAPDFFGNPATGNYWGIWNYGEFIGYIGVIPLFLALSAMIWRKDKKTLFFGTILFLSLIFATPTFLAKLPYKFKIPFISTSQPTRLLFLIDFSLAILAALGFDYLMMKGKSLIVQITKLLGVMGIVYGTLWVFVLFFDKFGLSIPLANILVAKRNLILPTFVFIAGSIGIIFTYIVSQKSFRASPASWRGKSRNLTPSKTWSVKTVLFLLIIFDLFRFGWKFTPFSKKQWIFPSTKIIETLKKDASNYRIMALDRKIMPPNFSSAYHLQDVSGYDPLYLKNYGQLVSSWEKGKPDISSSSFNRIITPHKAENIITNLLGVKYFLSFGPVESSDLELIEKEGETFLYENRNVFPRAFFVEEIVKVQNTQGEIEKIFQLEKKLASVAVANEDINIKPQKILPEETVEIVKYEANNIEIITKSEFKRLLITTDMYYPSWKAYIDGRQTKIYKVDFALRGVIVPKGRHRVEFKTNLF